MKSCMVLAPRPPTQLKQAILWGATPPRPTGLIPDTALGLKRYEYRSWWSKRNASCLLSLNARRISRTSRPILGTYRSFWQRYLHPTRCAQQRMQSKRSRSPKKFWSCPILLVATPGPLRSWICIDRKSLQWKWESPQCRKGSSTGGLILKRTRRSCSHRVKTASTSHTANLQERYTPLPSLMLFLMLKIGKYFQYITTNCIVDHQSFFSPPNPEIAAVAFLFDPLSLS